MAEEGKGFWSTLPGILTGVATVLTALTGLIVALSGGDPAKPAETLANASEATSQPSNAAFSLSAVIDDPSGFTNVRSLQSSSGQIVARVVQDERFFTHVQQGNWWQVRTAEGKIGYMHVSRIKLISKP